MINIEIKPGSPKTKLVIKAIYMLFCEEYSKENPARLSEKIVGLGPFDVCYENDPKRPILLALANTHSPLFIFKLYKTLHVEACNDKSNVI